MRPDVQVPTTTDATHESVGTKDAVVFGDDLAVSAPAAASLGLPEADRRAKRDDR